MDVAVVEAGLGGRLDATNVLDARVVLLTNVSLEHTDVLGDTREAIAREKLAVAGPERDRRARRAGVGVPSYRTTMCGSAEPARRRRRSSAAPIEGTVEVSLPGASNGAAKTEIWDGAHTPEGIDWLLERTPRPRAGSSSARCSPTRTSTRCSSALPPSRRRLVATQSSNARALPAAELAGRARRYVSHVVALEDPVAAVREARTLGDAVLVTGSLYLLADLHGARWE